MFKIKKFLTIPTFALLCILFYGNTFNHFFSLDDKYFLDHLPKTIDDISTCFDVFKEKYDEVDYRPIPVFTFALEKMANDNELNPATSHKINVLIFFLGACMLFFTIMQLKIPESFLIAFITTLLFIAHPIHSNVVSSLKNRDILLSFFFAISSIFLFLRFINSESSIRKSAYLILSVVTFFFALISKMDSIWVLVAAPLLLINSSKKTDWKPIITRVIIVAIIFLFVATIFKRMFISSLVELENVSDIDAILFTENPIIEATFLGKIYYIFVTLFYHFKFLTVPFGYYYYFGHKMIGPPHIFQPYFILGIFTTIALLYIFFKTFKKNGIITMGLIFWGLSAFYCTNILRPVSGIVDPRLLYHTSAGFCFLLAGFIYYISQKSSVISLFNFNVITKHKYNLPIIFTTLIVLSYLPFTYSRNLDWQNIFSLIESDIPHLKNSFQANRIATFHYIEGTKFENDRNERDILAYKGLQTSINAIKVDPNRINMQEAKGIALNLLGVRDSAKNQFKLIIERFDTSEVAWDMLGDIYYSENKLDSASWCYFNTIRVSESYARVYYKYTNSMIRIGKIDSVKTFYENKLRENPEWFVFYDNLSYIYINKKDTLNSGRIYLEGTAKGLKEANLLIMFRNYFSRNGYTQEQKKTEEILSTLSH